MLIKLTHMNSASHLSLPPLGLVIGTGRRHVLTTHAREPFFRTIFHRINTERILFDFGIRTYYFRTLFRTFEGNNYRQLVSFSV